MRTPQIFQADLEKVDEIRRMFREFEDRSDLWMAWSTTRRVSGPERSIEVTETDWDFIHYVNLKAIFFCCQQRGPLMQNTGAGRIVNISSLGGIRPWRKCTRTIARRKPASLC